MKTEPQLPRRNLELGLRFAEPGPETGVACFHLADLPLWTASHRVADPERLVVHASGRVVSCSQQCQARGVRAGDSLDRVQALVPEAVLHPHDPLQDELAAEEILRGLNARTPRLQRLNHRRLRGVWVILSQLTAAELQEVAARSGGQCGMAPQRSVAMLAAAAAAPGQARIVRPGGEVSFLRAIPVSLLTYLGFSEELTQALDFLGIFRMSDCLRFTDRQLTARFGAEGLALYRLIHPEGRGGAPVFSPNELSVCGEVDWPVSEPDELLPHLYRLREQALQALGERVCRAVSLRLWTRHGGSRQQQAMLKTPTRSVPALDYQLARLLHQLLDSSAEVHRIELRLRGIGAGAESQPSIFGGDRPQLRQVVEIIERRFPGKSLRPVANKLFGFPEEAYSLVPYTDHPTATL